MTNQPMTEEVADRVERTCKALERAIASDEAKRDAARKEARADFLDAFGRRRDANGIVVDVHGRDRGTTQTRTKMRPDTLVLLLNRGPERGLSQEQYDAAQLIRAAVLIIVGGMALKACSMERMGGGRSDGETETQWAVRVQEDYNAWVDAMGERAAAAKQARRDSRAWQTGPVMDIVVDGMTCNEVSAARCMRDKSIVPALRDALDLYNETRKRGRDRKAKKGA